MKFLKKILFSVLVLIVSVIWNQFYLNASLSSSLKNDLTQKLKMISRDRPFVDFTLGFSSQEKSVIDQMKIKPANAFDYYGDLKNLKSEVVSYIESFGNDKVLSLKIATIINRVVKDTISAFNVNAVWVTIRSFKKQINGMCRDGIQMVIIMNLMLACNIRWLWL